MKAKWAKYFIALFLSLLTGVIPQKVYGAVCAPSFINVPTFVVEGGSISGIMRRQVIAATNNCNPGQGLSCAPFHVKLQFYPDTNFLTTELQGWTYVTDHWEHVLSNTVSGDTSFTLTFQNNSVKQPHRSGILIFTKNDGDQFPMASCLINEVQITVLDDDTSIVTMTADEPQSFEAGAVPGSFLVTRSGVTNYALTVNFTRSGTATHANDYTLAGNSISTNAATNSVTIPAGAYSTKITVSPANDLNPEAAETVVLNLAEGNYYADATQKGGTVTIVDDDPVVSIAGTDTVASESGDSGLFTVTRTADTGAPLAVKYLISGTANNGVDYAYLSNSVVIPAGETFATVTVAPIFDTTIEGNETVILTLVTNGYQVGTVSNATVTISDFDDNSRTTPLLGGGVDPGARYGRFVRGSGTDANYHSFLIPLDFQQGIALSNSTGNAATLFPGIGWNTTMNHFNAVFPPSPIAFSNPIAAFGNRVGGSPLYFDQPYSFGIYAGDPRPPLTNTTTYADALRIKVYHRNTFSLVATTNFAIPHISSTNEWITFLTNGYRKTVTSHGLTTTLSFNNSGVAWDVLLSTNSSYDIAYHLSHRAADTGTNFIYLVELAGGTEQGWTVKDSGGSRAWSPLYTVEFEARPPWRSVMLKPPQFFGQPMPPGYLGRSAEELMTNGPVVTNLVSLPNAPTTYTNLDRSPELRRHPVLDRFVADMGRDPILLANYVLNEIELTDAIDYNDSGAVSEISVNLGGVRRGALGTFLEGQGSPTEQCALLVYLMRQAGYPAVYVFPPHNGLQMVDSRLSKLLRMQVRGAVNSSGSAYTTNRMIPVNYPWVAAYIGTNWVHVFPWLKDTQVETGFDLYSLMPAQYDNALKWSLAYVRGDAALLGLSPEDDSPLAIYPRFIKKALLENAPGISEDDIGIKAWNRRHYFSRWTDFPAPTYVTNACIPVESLGDSSITNVSPALTNIFDTVSVEISSVSAPAKKVSTGELRLAELHNRRLVAWHTKVATNQHTLILSLASFRTNITAQKAFASALLNNATDTNCLVNLVTNVSLAGTDDFLLMTLVNKRHRSLPGGFSQPPTWSPYLGFGSPLVITNQRNLRKGDLAAMVTSSGRVTRKMLDQHAMPIWQMEKAGVAGTTEQYQGSLACLMGLSYFEKVDRFNAYTAQLHGTQPISFFASGLAMLRAKRDANGNLPNGDIIPVQPVLDMFYREDATLGNGTVRLDSGDDGYGAPEQVFELHITAGSALEHVVLNRFFKQSDSVSTVRLLQLAQKSTNPIVTLTRYNYLTEGEKTFGATNKLKEASPGAWREVTNRFNTSFYSNNVLALMTPGKIANDSGSYSGVGALIFSPQAYSALISDGLNGGYSPQLPDSTLASSSLPQTSLKVDTDNNFVLDSTPVALPNSVLSGQAVSVNDQPQLTSLLNNTYTLADVERLGLDQTKLALNVSSTDRGDQKEAQYDNGMMDKGPKKDSWLDMGIQWVSDPVNSISGEFYIDTVDLSLNGPMPLEVRRNYSSHNVFDNDLGYGWKLSYMPFLSVSTDTTNLLLYAAEADGSVIQYRRQTNGAGAFLNTWTPLPQDNPRLKNAFGSVGNLYNSVITRTTNASVVTYTLLSPDGGLRTYPVRTFSLGGGVDRTRPYLDRWQDGRSNYFQFYYGTNSGATDFGQVNRIESSSGNFLGFLYDIYGHIVEAFTGDGRRIAYEYDDYGDLIRVQLPDSSEISYQYAHQAITTNSTRELYSTHLLIREEKPDGRVLQNDYDGERRVVNQYATVGYDLRLIRNASFAYSNNFTFASSLTNLTAGYTLVTDYLTNSYRYEYTNGLVTKVVDPLNRTNSQTYYADNETNAPAYPRSLKRTVDERGLVTDYFYDPQGNTTNVTVTGDLTGDGVIRSAVTRYSFNSNRLLTNMVDAVGNWVAFTYTNGLSPFLRTSEARYASNGTAIAASVFTYTNVPNPSPVGNYVGSFGLMTREVRAFGTSDAATNDVVHDPRGFVTQRTRLTGTADPASVQSFYYNLRGELVQQTDSAGRTSQFSYTPRGQIEWKEVFDEQGKKLAGDYSYYNLNGELTWSDGPRFDPEDYVRHEYDGAGRKVEETRWRTRAKADGSGVEAETGDALFATSFYEYDPFSNLVKVIDPRGNYTRMRYDAVGQLLERRAYDGTASTNAMPLSIERFSYEPGGKVAFQTNALGGVTETLYTSTGQPKYRKNPDGSTNAWRYYLDGRLEREVQPNGAYVITTYADSLRKTTKVFYSATGTALSTNTTEMDRRGNVFRSVDALGLASTNLFDGLDRLKIAAGPVVGSIYRATTNFYDAAGIVSTNINSVGDKTVSWTDALGRTVRSEIRDKNNLLVRETSTAYSANHHGVTTTNGSGATALVATTFTDNDGHPVLSIGYPAANTTEFSRSQYDAVGNLVAETRHSSTNGNLTTWTTASFGYDGLNRLRAQTNRDGAVFTFAYDPAGNLTNRAMPGGISWVASYDTAGRMTKDFNLGSGNSGTRTNTYAYHTTGPWTGLLQSRTDGRGVVSTPGYDHWLRTTTNVHSGSLDEQDMTVTWNYDVRGLVTNVSQAYALSGTGPSTAIHRRYDGYGLLTNETVLVAGLPLSSAALSWDRAARRSSLAIGGQTYGFGWQADGLMVSNSVGSGASLATGAYGYTTAGLLTNRLVATRQTAITSRDGTGRPLGLTTRISGSPVLTETLSYTGDGLISVHTLDRAGFVDSRSYFYANQSRRLIEERLNLDGSKRWTNTFGYDGGSAAGPGVLTRAGQPQTSGAVWSSKGDPLQRVALETNKSIFFPAYGQVNGPAKVGVTLDGVPQAFTVVGTNGGQWLAPLELAPGAHQLIATAEHPSGTFTTNRNAWVTNSVTAHTTTNLFDGDGNLYYRVGRNVNGTTNRTQLFVWDAKGQLVKLTERDATGAGRDWSAVFDPLGRRVMTIEYPVTNNIAVLAQPKTLVVYFDPLAEFQEMGVAVDGVPTWKLKGPDLSGTYAGLNGLGGFEGVATATGLNPTLGDARGNLLGTHTSTGVVWYASRPTGYGAVPGYRPVPLGQGADLAEASAWRGRWADGVGTYQIGLRPYQPISGSWMSYDSVWNDGDPTGYGAFAGDPVNLWDGDGRLAKGFAGGYGSSSVSGDASAAYMAAYYMGGILNGYHEGARGGASITANTLSFGATDGLGLTHSANYQGWEYDGTRILATGGRELLITAGTLGSAQAFRATGQISYGLAASGGEIYSTYQNASAIIDGYQNVSEGNNWGYAQAAFGALGLRGNVSAFDELASGLGALNSTQVPANFFQRTRLEVEALQAQGLSRNEAFSQLRRFNAGHADGYVFHFTTPQGARGILNDGVIKPSTSGVAGPGVYTGTTPTPGWFTKNVPFAGWGLGGKGANVRIPVQTTQQGVTPWLPPNTKVFREPLTIGGGSQ